MLGAIIGDIIGSRWEFHPMWEYSFELFSERNCYTDDTVCTIAIADAILKGRDYGESLHDWCRRYPAGYGSRFAEWVASDTPRPYSSFGNGSAMRVSPIGMYFRTDHDVMQQAGLSAACTHNHPAGINGARAVANAVLLATRLTDGLVNPADVVKEVRMFPVSCGTDFGFERVTDINDYRNKFDATCQGTIPPAMHILASSYSFEDAVRNAVTLCADADTLGAIVGSIAEHIWGIPAWIKEKALTYLPQEMRDVVTAFYAACQARTDYRPKDRRLKQQELLMLWKLGFGLRTIGPQTETKRAIQLQPMPDDGAADMEANFPFSAEAMAVIRQGHAPVSDDDNWIMTCTGDTVRFYRSQTGSCMFEARCIPDGEGGCTVQHIRASRRLATLGINGDTAARYLLCYLLHSTVAGHHAKAWQRFFDVWKICALLNEDIE